MVWNLILNLFLGRCRTYGASNSFLLPFPALTGWANVFRAYGACLYWNGSILARRLKSQLLYCGIPSEASSNQIFSAVTCREGQTPTSRASLPYSPLQ